LLIGQYQTQLLGQPYPGQDTVLFSNIIKMKPKPIKRRRKLKLPEPLRSLVRETKRQMK
jgi:hypothetical protein